MTKQEFDNQFPGGKIKVKCHTMEEDRILFHYARWLGVDDSPFGWDFEFPFVGASTNSQRINRWRECAEDSIIIEFSDWYAMIFGNQDEEISDVEEIL